MRKNIPRPRKKNINTILDLILTTFCMFFGVLCFIASALLIMSSDPSVVPFTTVVFVALFSFVGAVLVCTGATDWIRSLAKLIRALKERHNR